MPTTRDIEAVRDEINALPWPERLRLAALQGDSMTQQPILVTPGEECWKVKESKVGEGVPGAAVSPAPGGSPGPSPRGAFAGASAGRRRS